MDQRRNLTKPKKGRTVQNKRLADALKKKETAFTQQEWEAFGITDLRFDHFIKSGDSYFKPE